MIEYTAIDGCRSCGSSELRDVIAFGNMPLADGFRTDDQLRKTERRYPLTTVFCEACSLLQIRETVDPPILFADDYPYYSSFSSGWLEHCRDNAVELIRSRSLAADSLVVELASNDGYLLRNFVEHGIPVLGIDPVPGPAAVAEQHGVPTLREFFSLDLAQRLVAEGRKADVVLGNNVLAHVADLSGFVDGIRILLNSDGVAVIEVPYVRDLIEDCEFDTIYHEHLCYFSVTALDRLFADRGLTLSDVRRLPTHGGSLRLYVTKRSSDRSSAVGNLLAEEAALGMNNFRYYADFAERVRDVQAALVQCLDSLRSGGHSVCAYGAAAKGAMLLNTSGVGPDYLDYVVDRNIHKHGRYMPGVDLPICSPRRLLKSAPDYVLVLAWNHFAEIARQQADYRNRGGQFIIPIPHCTVV